jgi:hypothetical protein
LGQWRVRALSGLTVICEGQSSHEHLTSIGSKGVRIVKG